MLISKIKITINSDVLSFQVGPNAENCDRMAVDVGDGKKPISSSDDSIIRTSDTEGGSSNVYSTTHQSFLQRRQRHSSVPQTSAQVRDRFFFFRIETLAMMRGPDHSMGPITIHA